MKEHLLVSGEVSLNEALKQALQLEAAKTEARPEARSQEVEIGGCMRIWSPETERRRTGRPVCWQCEDVCHLRRECRRSRDEKNALKGRRPGFKKGLRDGTKSKAPASPLSSRRLTRKMIAKGNDNGPHAEGRT